MFGNSSFGNTSFGQTSFGATPSLGAFGSATQQPTQTPIGTTIKLTPSTATETNQVRDSKTGTSSSATVTVRFQHVCAMKEYESKSIEELRLEDYAANRKFGQQQQQQQTTFGFGSSPFGLNQPSSSQPTTNLFGAPSSSTSTGLFGQPNATTNTNTNLFGSSFSKPATSTASPFGISSPLGSTTNTTTNASIFGQPKTGFEANNTTNNLFGSTMNKPATSTTPAFGMGSTFGFGANQTTMNQPAASQPTTNLFGAQPSNTNNSLFGQSNASTSNNTTLFGSNAFNKPATSTASPFGMTNPLGSNTSTNANTSIFGQPKTGFDANNTTNSLFGSTMNKPATSTTPAFGMGSSFGFGSNQTGMTQPASSQPATNLFGGQTTNTATSLFGQPSAPANTSSNLFASFNKPATSAASPFGMGSPLGTNTNTNNNNSIFGQPKTGFEANTTTNNLFGSTMNKPATSTTPAFGTGSPFGFNTNQTTMNQPAANQPTTNLFGAQPTNTSNSLFGQPNTSTSNNTSLFGTSAFNKPATSTASPFGMTNPLGSNTSTNANTSIFGQPKTGFDANNTTNSLFGSALSKPATSTTPAFGMGSTFGFGSSPIGMNQPNTSQPSTSLFGASSPNSNTSLFGQSNTSLGTTTSLFGPTFNKPNTSSTSPFAISSPLNSNSNPTISQYKMSAKTNVKLNKPAEIVKPRTSTVLFDGLEDGNSDDLRCAIDVFVPKKSIKKLELKPTQEEQSSSSFNESQVRSNSPVVEDISRRYCLTNTRPEYKLKPSLEEIDKHYNSEKNTCIINYLLVERPNYGSIHFDGPLDVNNINLDEIVHIRRKEVVVYPDDENKPPVGQGLNRPATVTLYQVWPIDKSNNEIIKDVNRLNLMRYPEKVESDTIKIGARFIEYRPETGSWVFAVKHFSKYGITDDDEEISNNVIPPTPQSTHQPTPPPPLRLTNGSRFSIDSTPHSDPPANGEGVLLNRLKKSLVQSKDSSPVSFKMSAKKNLDLSSSKTTIASNLNETKPKSVMFESFDESNYSIRHVLDEFFNEDNETESRLNDSKRSLTVHGTKRLALQNVSSNVLNISNQDHNASSLYVGVTNIPKQKRVRNIQPKPDLYPARNKILRDISSVCISGSPRIRFIIGSRRLCYAKGSQIHIGELSLAQPEDLTEKLEEHLRENSIVVPFDAQPWDFLFAPYIETKDFIGNASSHELLRALYGNDLESKTPYDKQDERMSRVINWLANVNLEIQPPDELYQLIIYHMSCDRYDLATSLAIEHDHPRLALLIATQPNLKNDYIYEQLSSWRSTAADQYIDRELLRIYILLSGLTEWKLSDGSVIYCLKGLKWTQQLCLLANHVTSFASEPDRYGFHLLPLYMKRLDTDTNDVDYHILARHSPAMILSAAKSIADEWFLLESLKSYYVINSESECINSDMIHCNLASQFVAVDLRWACFVALHIINNDVRKQVLLKCLEQNQSQMKTAESWLKQWLMIPDEFFMKASSNV